MQNYLLRNLSELAGKRAIIMRDEAQLWDILARDLKREAARQEEAQDTRRIRTRPIPPVSTKAAPDLNRLAVRIPEAARMMGIGRSTIYVEINAGRLKVRKSGRKTLVPIAEIEAWMRNLPMR